MRSPFPHTVLHQKHFHAAFPANGILRFITQVIRDDWTKEFACQRLWELRLNRWARVRAGGLHKSVLIEHCLTREQEKARKYSRQGSNLIWWCFQATLERANRKDWGQGHQRIVLIILSGLRFLNCQMKMTATLHPKVLVMTEKTKA